MQQARPLGERLDELNGAVARVDLTAEHSVTFFESAPGLITVRERHPRGMPSVLPSMDPEKSSSVELFKRLAPSREAPPALVEADARLTEAIANEERYSGTQEPQVGGGISSLAEPPAAEEGRIRSALTAADVTVPDGPAAVAGMKASLSMLKPLSRFLMRNVCTPRVNVAEAVPWAQRKPLPSAVRIVHRDPAAVVDAIKPRVVRGIRVVVDPEKEVVGACSGFEAPLSRPRLSVLILVRSAAGPTHEATRHPSGLSARGP